MRYEYDVPGMDTLKSTGEAHQTAPVTPAPSLVNHVTGRRECNRRGNQSPRKPCDLRSTLYSLFERRVSVELVWVD